MKWSPQQNEALSKVAEWHQKCMAELRQENRLSQPIFRIFGYAGTGKTTLARHFADQIDGKTTYSAFTGKAAMVMHKSGCEGATTIHNLIYDVKQNPKTGAVSFEWDADGPVRDAHLNIIDECSMVDADLGGDFLAYNRPILVLGDPAQLPPVKTRREEADGTGAGYFTEAEPDVMLTEIHRQAKDNPIIYLATQIREGGSIEHGRYGDCWVTDKKKVTSRDVIQADQVLVGTNKTRGQYNARIRQLLGRVNLFPEPDDRLVCLKNNRSTGIFNGGLFEVVNVHPKRASLESKNRMGMTVRSLDTEGMNALDVECRLECWTGGLFDVDWRDKKGADEFDYGYALTVHKSQGSQWDHVVLYDQSFAFRDDWRKWLYTGITRAAKSITIAR